MKHFGIGLALGSLLAIGGFYLGQYAPLDSSFLATIASPYSPLRWQLAVNHAAIAGTIGFFLGIIISLAASKRSVLTPVRTSRRKSNRRKYKSEHAKKYSVSQADQIEALLEEAKTR